jgi:hypothetical protein
VLDSGNYAGRPSQPWFVLRSPPTKYYEHA